LVGTRVRNRALPKSECPHGRCKITTANYSKALYRMKIAGEEKKEKKRTGK